jgi:ribonucleoside-diphosphate reductase alpha chain
VRVYTYEEALNASIDYFNGDDLAAAVFVDKYALRNLNDDILELTPVDMHRRIAKELARIESSKFKNPMTEDEIFEYLDGFKRFVPGGSLLFGIGNKFQYTTLSNCYVVDSVFDCYGGICSADEDIVQISKRRGGCGLDISKLRPNGTITTNAAKTSTGALTFLKRFSHTIREVGQSGRRGALMVTMNIHHPEVLEFATVKQNLSEVVGANLSIRLSKEFVDAVENDELYEQRWPVDSKNPSISKMVSARDVWKMITKCARDFAEPGLLFWESVSDSYKELGYETISTNPCAELPLSAGDSCRLGLLNLFTYVNEPFTKNAKFDFDRFSSDAKVAQRFMDDIIDLELEHISRIIEKVKSDPEPFELKRHELELWEKIYDACYQGRRTGTGITALGDTIAALGIAYGSAKSIELTESIYKTLKLSCYRSSVDMAKELGSFEIFNHDLESKNPFLLRIKDEDPKLYRDMKKHGRRNIAINTTAPAGSISCLTQTTSGIEPLYLIELIRRKKVNPNDVNSRVDHIDENGDKWQNFTVLHPKVNDWIDISENHYLHESPWHGACAMDIDWKSRVDIQAAAQRHVDHSISSTINLPFDITEEEVAGIYMYAYKKRCKGITVYRDGSRENVISAADKEPDDELRITHTNAPSRPKKLPCDVYHISVKGQKYFVIVGLLSGDPYEVFAGKAGGIPKSASIGVLNRIKRGVYSLELPNGDVVESLSECEDPEEDAMSRLISSSLRHGVPIDFIVQQLEKSNGHITGFSKSIARALKKYIPDGTKISGEECEQCGSILIRQSGCAQCNSCGWSKCL